MDATHQSVIADRGQRVATALVYLNDGYKGGDTAFPVLGLSYRGQRGDAIAFRNVDETGLPDRRMLHAGRPPENGEKWLLSKWVRDRNQLGRLW